MSPVRETCIPTLGFSYVVNLVCRDCGDFKIPPELLEDGSWDCIRGNS